MPRRLVARASSLHKPHVPPRIFDRDARRLRRNRVTSTELEQHVCDALLERLAQVSRRFERALVVNTGSGLLAAALRAQGTCVAETDHGSAYNGERVDEDALKRSETFDLVVIPTGLDTVDDLPGALIVARRALASNGLFLASLWGAPGLATLKIIVAQVDGEFGRSAARVHPQVDVRTAGDLLVRAGFALPVADAETVTLRYSSFDALVRDIRTNGAGNVLAQRHAVSRSWLLRARQHFAERAQDGRTSETATLITLTGWQSP